MGMRAIATIDRQHTSTADLAPVDPWGALNTLNHAGVSLPSWVNPTLYVMAGALLVCGLVHAVLAAWVTVDSSSLTRTREYAQKAWTFAALGVFLLVLTIINSQVS